jgi:hypothetical protein
MLRILRSQLGVVKETSCSRLCASSCACVCEPIWLSRSRLRSSNFYAWRSVLLFNLALFTVNALRRISLEVALEGTSVSDTGERVS